MISRSGVIDYANSLDTVGFLARDCDSLKSLFGKCAIFLHDDVIVIVHGRRQTRRMRLTRMILQVWNLLLERD